MKTEKLESYLSKELKIEAPLKIQKFSFGQSNPTYLLIDKKKKPDGTLISKKAHAVEREYQILNALSIHTRVPVPKPYILCEDTTIMEYLDGVIYEDLKMNALTLNDARNNWREAIRSLAELHLVNYKKVGLSQYGNNSNYYERQINTLLKISELQSQVKNVEILEDVKNLKSKFYKFEINDECSIVHGDYKMFKHGKVIGILDWELSTLGSPLFDLANLLQPFYIQENILGKNKNKTMLQQVKDRYSLEFLEELIQLYCRLVNRQYPIKNWYVWLSVILQGISARLHLGQASSDLASDYASITVPVSIHTHFYLDLASLIEFNKL